VVDVVTVAFSVSTALQAGYLQLRPLVGDQTCVLQEFPDANRFGPECAASIGQREMAMTHDSHLAGAMLADGRRLPDLLVEQLYPRGVLAELLEIVADYLLFERVPLRRAANLVCPETG